MLALTLHPLTAVSIVVAIVAAFLLLMAWALFFCGAKDDRQTDRERDESMLLAQRVADLQAHRERRERGRL